MPLGMEVGLDQGDFVFDEDPALPRTKGTGPTHPIFGPTAGWIKMPLGTVVGFGPCHIVLDGDPAPPKSGTAAPLFCSMPIVATVAHLSYC